MTAVDDQAAGIVLEAQEARDTIHFGKLTAMFLKTLEAEGVDHVAAIHLTEEWMRGQAVEDESAD